MTHGQIIGSDLRLDLLLREPGFGEADADEPLRWSFCGCAPRKGREGWRGVPDSSATFTAERSAVERQAKLVL